LSRHATQPQKPLLTAEAIELRDVLYAAPAQHGFALECGGCSMEPARVSVLLVDGLVDDSTEGKVTAGVAVIGHREVFGRPEA